MDTQNDYVAAANAGGPYSIEEGSLLVLNAQGTTDTDTDINTLVYTWDLDADEVFDDASGITANYAWPDNGTQTIAVKATNSQSGTVGIAFGSITVTNAQPLIVQVDNQTAVIGESLTVSTTYSDPGLGDTHTVTVNWGDLTVESDIPVSGGTISLSHTYITDDTYIAEITVYDDDGASSSTMFDVVVSQTSILPVVILPQIEIGEGVIISWDFDILNPSWNLVDIVSGNSYTDTGDLDGFDDTLETLDDRLPPSEVDSRFYIVVEVAD